MNRNTTKFAIAALVVTLAAAFSLPSRAAAMQVILDPTRSFSDPTQVNLLERWNTDGTYAFTTTVSDAGNGVLRTVDFHRDGNAYRISPVNSLNRAVTVRFTFDTPRTISQTSLEWRAANHSPDNYTWRDQAGVFATGTMVGGFPGSPTIIDSFAPRTSNFVELEFDPPNTGTDVFELVHVGAFLAPGQALPMDGTYNLFYEETPIRTGFNDNGNWTDKQSKTFASPTVGGNSIMWEFENTYSFQGAYMTHLGEGAQNVMIGTTVEVSDDGSLFTQVFGPQTVGSSYMVFSQQAMGRFVRLSWTANGDPEGVGGGRELTQFQLFGVLVVPVPEPSTAALAMFALAGLAAGRRRSPAARLARMG